LNENEEVANMSTDDPKAVIQVLEGNGLNRTAVKETIPVKFNPTEYTLDKSLNYGDQSLLGLTSPITQFVSGSAETLSLELFFDTYEDGEDVRTKYTDRIDALLTKKDGRTAPPICNFVWGETLTFTAVLQSARKQFTMFLNNGTPVRARVNVTFKEFRPPERQKLEVKGEGATKTSTKVRLVKQGDTLWQIAGEEYKDPKKWRLIADANGITDPRTLQAGTQIQIPPLKET
jgi:hypothetical protein